jgi:hypothetical protein
MTDREGLAGGKAEERRCRQAGEGRREGDEEAGRRAGRFIEEAQEQERASELECPAR